MTKYPGKTNLMEKESVLSYCSRVLSFAEGKLRQLITCIHNQKAERGECWGFASFLVLIQALNLQNGATHSEGGS